MPNLDSQILLLIILGVVALALVGQTLLLFAVFAVIRKTAKSVSEQLEDVRSAAMPVIYNTRELFKRVAPNIEDTAADLAAMAHGLRTQTADIQSQATDLLDKFNHQSKRLDGMVTGLFDAVDRASQFVTETVSKPIRQLNGILSTVKSMVESMRPHAPEPPPPVAPYPPPASSYQPPANSYQSPSSSYESAEEKDMFL